MSRPHCKATGKVCFLDEHQAQDVLEQRRERHRGERRCYRCPDCGRWHLTSWSTEHRPPTELVIDLRGVPTPRDLAVRLGWVTAEPIKMKEQVMGDIGEPRRTIEVEPLPNSEPFPEQVPAIPEREKVPA